MKNHKPKQQQQKKVKWKESLPRSHLWNTSTCALAQTPEQKVDTDKGTVTDRKKAGTHTQVCNTSIYTQQVSAESGRV